MLDHLLRLAAASSRRMNQDLGAYNATHLLLEVLLISSFAAHSSAIPLPIQSTVHSIAHPTGLSL